MLAHILSGYVISILYGCNIINPSEDIPSYIDVDSFSLNITDPLTQGSFSSKIVDVWAFVDNDLIGIFELPTRIQVLKEGEHQLLLSAGIIENGIASIRNTYPFYEPYTATITLQSLSSSMVAPVISYRANTQFTFMENFEGAGLKFEKINGAIDIKKTNSEVFEGLSAGEISLTVTDSFSEIASSQEFLLPNNNNPAFLELNYKCNIEFAVGLMDAVTLTKVYIVVINPKNSWNKMYVNLTPTVKLFSASKYKLIFNVVASDQTATSSVYIDNIKVLYN